MAQEPVTLIAYGSLMSGLGLAGLGHLPVLRVTPARVRNARRGFGKLSQYGDRYAMVLEPLHPQTPVMVDTASAEGDGFDALALTMSLNDFARVAVREGYQAAAVFALAEEAAAKRVTLTEYLWGVLKAANHDLAGYRGGLVDAIGYTSPHYIPHPLQLADGGLALTFLAPGDEGSGSPDVLPVRVRTGMTQLLTLAETWSRKPNASQLDYFAMCLLAEMHHLSFADVVDDLDDELRAALQRRLASELAVEPARFRAVLGLSRDDYIAHFGGWSDVGLTELR